MTSEARTTSRRQNSSCRGVHPGRYWSWRPGGGAVTDRAGERSRLSLSSPHKTVRYLVAVDGLSFTLLPGTVTGFLGPNGAGKTTTLRMVLGLVRPTVGTALVFGRRYAELEDSGAQGGCGARGGGLPPGRSGRDHLMTLALAARIPAARVDEALGLVELTAAARRRVGPYSLGMRQRLGLAAALLGDPALPILHGARQRARSGRRPLAADVPAGLRGAAAGRCSCRAMFWRRWRRPSTGS